MTHSTDPELDAALAKDAGNLDAAEQDAGPQLEDFDFDDGDTEDDDGFGFSEEDCGRWLNGRLSDQCRLAGSEDCDWECPIGIGGKL